MTQITLKGNPIHTSGSLPSIGSPAKDFSLIGRNLGEVKLSDFKGKNVLLNIFPSLDTEVCATSVRKFNSTAAQLDNTVVLCISRDLPFAHGRFCSTEGIDKVITASEFQNHDFSHDYGLDIVDGPMKGLHARSVIVVNPEGKIIYTEQVPEITREPDYDQAIEAITAAK
ncbi:MAG: thiol peroxidase [Bacteroidales bacterium]|nr:thiol peroxidase [Bacteroidales bacterium]MDD2323452.1 thiol peroxidase [Bacteroidales bacterium]MDD3010075.1 thiol peroxidase [Bacteroidales bacterium]MDD3961562.1 thiol peroxidase [Bacteroidales bacterium]MDY0285028.1 thiol peroxidase [Bacteroidales bacterium]